MQPTQARPPNTVSGSTSQEVAQSEYSVYVVHMLPPDDGFLVEVPGNRRRMHTCSPPPRPGSCQDPM